MSSSAMAEKTIAATCLDDEQRLSAFSKHFGKRLMEVEAFIMGFARRLCPEYDGGYWEFYELSNGGFYMAVRGPEKRWKLNVDTNGYSGEFSSDAMGIIVCLFAYSHMSFKTYEAGDEVTTEALAEHHSALIAYAAQHAEASEIFSAID